MKKALMFGFLLLLVLIVLSGCGGTEEDVAENGQETPAPTENVQVATENEENVIDNGQESSSQAGNVQISGELEQMVNHFRSAGLEIGQYHEKNYEIIGATDGFGLEIEGGDIELYYYDPDKADSDILDSLESKHNPDATYAIMINGYYELAVALHPEQDRIIEVFMSF